MKFARLWIHTIGLWMVRIGLYLANSPIRIPTKTESRALFVPPDEEEEEENWLPIGQPAAVPSKEAIRMKMETFQPKPKESLAPIVPLSGSTRDRLMRARAKR